jgi:hypothetical protein
VPQTDWRGDLATVILSAAAERMAEGAAEALAPRTIF